ncbi:MAG: phospholipase D family protein [Chitinophagales bacterium]
MAKFLTTNGISLKIEDIIKGAKKKLILVSPYLQISKTFYERLKDATNKGVIIKIIYGKDNLNPNERKQLADLKILELYYFENLHAKCYFNETEMVITSMNMYEYSMKNNREMGVLINRMEDSELFNDTMEECKSILEHAEMVRLTKTKIEYFAQKINTFLNKPKKPTKVEYIKAKKPAKTEYVKATKVEYEKVKPKKKKKAKKQKYKPQRGYCIRCEANIAYNIEKPYCLDCFVVWANFENPYYEENVCHGCGDDKVTSMEKPVCYGCYKEFEK